MLAAVDAELLYPLAYFCRRDGRQLPAFEVVEPDAMPEIARKLLVHTGDMTSRLEQHYGGETVLQVVHCEHTPSIYRREVLLCLAGNGLPVEYGAIEIDLGAFTGELQDLIVEAQLPLGGLLNRFRVQYHSKPRAFLKLSPDLGMNALFAASGATELYGRSNILCDKDDRVLARIVEVLRPLENGTSYVYV
jgi:chorismate-pyruvate lyase